MVLVFLGLSAFLLMIDPAEALSAAEIRWVAIQGDENATTDSDFSSQSVATVQDSSDLSGSQTPSETPNQQDGFAPPIPNHISQ